MLRRIGRALAGPLALLALSIIGAVAIYALHVPAP